MTATTWKLFRKGLPLGELHRKLSDYGYDEEEIEKVLSLYSPTGSPEPKVQKTPLSFDERVIITGPKARKEKGDGVDIIVDVASSNIKEGQRSTFVQKGEQHSEQSDFNRTADRQTEEFPEEFVEEPSEESLEAPEKEERTKQREEHVFPSNSSPVSSLPISFEAEGKEQQKNCEETSPYVDDLPVDPPESLAEEEKTTEKEPVEAVLADETQIMNGFSDRINNSDAFAVNETTETADEKGVKEAEILADSERQCRSLEVETTEVECPIQENIGEKADAVSGEEEETESSTGVQQSEVALTEEKDALRKTEEAKEEEDDASSRERRRLQADVRSQLRKLVKAKKKLDAELDEQGTGLASVRRLSSRWGQWMRKTPDQCLPPFPLLRVSSKTLLQSDRNEKGPESKKSNAGLRRSSFQLSALSFPFEQGNDFILDGSLFNEELLFLDGFYKDASEENRQGDSKSSEPDVQNRENRSSNTDEAKEEIQGDAFWSCVLASVSVMRRGGVIVVDRALDLALSLDSTLSLSLEYLRRVLREVEVLRKGKSTDCGEEEQFKSKGELENGQSRAGGQDEALRKERQQEKTYALSTVLKALLAVGSIIGVEDGLRSVLSHAADKKVDRIPSVLVFLSVLASVETSLLLSLPSMILIDAEWDRLQITAMLDKIEREAKDGAPIEDAYNQEAVMETKSRVDSVQSKIAYLQRAHAQTKGLRKAVEVTRAIFFYEHEWLRSSDKSFSGESPTLPTSENETLDELSWQPFLRDFSLSDQNGSSEERDDPLSNSITTTFAFVKGSEQILRPLSRQLTAEVMKCYQEVAVIVGARKPLSLDGGLRQHSETDGSPLPILPLSPSSSVREEAAALDSIDKEEYDRESGGEEVKVSAEEAQNSQDSTKAKKTRLITSRKLKKNIRKDAHDSLTKDVTEFLLEYLRTRPLVSRESSFVTSSTESGDKAEAAHVHAVKPSSSKLLRILPHWTDSYPENWWVRLGGRRSEKQKRSISQGPRIVGEGVTVSKKGKELDLSFLPLASPSASFVFLIQEEECSPSSTKATTSIFARIAKAKPMKSFPIRLRVRLPLCCSLKQLQRLMLSAAVRSVWANAAAIDEEVEEGTSSEQEKATGKASKFLCSLLLSGALSFAASLSLLSFVLSSKRVLWLIEGADRLSQETYRTFFSAVLAPALMTGPVILTAASHSLERGSSGPSSSLSSQLSSFQQLKQSLESVGVWVSSSRERGKGEGNNSSSGVSLQKVGDVVQIASRVASLNKASPKPPSLPRKEGASQTGRSRHRRVDKEKEQKIEEKREEEVKTEAFEEQNVHREVAESASLGRNRPLLENVHRKRSHSDGVAAHPFSTEKGRDSESVATALSAISSVEADLLLLRSGYLPPSLRLVSQPIKERSFSTNVRGDSRGPSSEPTTGAGAGSLIKLFSPEGLVKEALITVEKIAKNFGFDSETFKKLLRAAIGCNIDNNEEKGSCGGNFLLSLVVTTVLPSLFETGEAGQLCPSNGVCRELLSVLCPVLERKTTPNNSTATGAELFAASPPSASLIPSRSPLFATTTPFFSPTKTALGFGDKNALSSSNGLNEVEGGSEDNPLEGERVFAAIFQTVLELTRGSRKVFYDKVARSSDKSDSTIAQSLLHSSITKVFAEGIKRDSSSVGAVWKLVRQLSLLLADERREIQREDGRSELITNPVSVEKVLFLLAVVLEYFVGPSSVRSELTKKDNKISLKRGAYGKREDGSSAMKELRSYLESFDILFAEEEKGRFADDDVLTEAQKSTNPRESTAVSLFLLFSSSLALQWYRDNSTTADLSDDDKNEKEAIGRLLRSVDQRISGDGGSSSMLSSSVLFSAKNTSSTKTAKASTRKEEGRVVKVVNEAPSSVSTWTAVISSLLSLRRGAIDEAKLSLLLRRFGDYSPLFVRSFLEGLSRESALSNSCSLRLWNWLAIRSERALGLLSQRYGEESLWDKIGATDVSKDSRKTLERNSSVAMKSTTTSATVQNFLSFLNRPFPFDRSLEIEQEQREQSIVLQRALESLSSRLKGECFVDASAILLRRIALFFCFFDRFDEAKRIWEGISSTQEKTGDLKGAVSAQERAIRCSSLQAQLKLYQSYRQSAPFSASSSTSSSSSSSSSSFQGRGIRSQSRNEPKNETAALFRSVEGSSMRPLRTEDDELLDAIVNGRTEDVRNLSSMLHRLGMLYYKMGEDEKTVEYLSQCLTAKERAFGACSLDVAEILVSLGMAYRGMLDYATASSLLDRAMSIRAVTLGRDHPDTIAVEELLCSCDASEH